MEAVVYYPDTDDGMSELQQQVAEVHAGAVVNHIMKLTCPLEQKLQLVQAIQDMMKDGQKN